MNRRKRNSLFSRSKCLAADQAAEPEKETMSDKIHLVINDEEITIDEIEYEFFRSELIQAINSGSNETDVPAVETIITQIVQLRAVNCLAELKGVSTTPEEIQMRIAQFKSDMASSTVFFEKVAEFGEERFWKFEEKRYSTIINAEKIKNMLMEKEKLRYESNNGRVSEESIKFFVKKMFDDWVVEAAGMLKVSASY